MFIFRKEGTFIKIKMIVATHKVAPIPEENIYLPVFVGAEKNSANMVGYQRDDRGVNISFKNANYNELTAVYWAWKNLKNVDVIGLVHYRRYFLKAGKPSVVNVLNEEQLRAMLNEHDVILPKKRKYYIESNYSHYVHAHHKEPLDATRDIIATNFSEYLPSFDKVMSKREAHMFNMFVMRRTIFNNYCEWLFDILQKLELRIDISSYSTQETRVFGYIAEVLMDVWIDTNNINYVESKWGQVGKKHMVKKIFFFMVDCKFNPNFLTN